jgi:hypothetical protein
MNDRPSFVANGDINPCRFVKIDVTYTTAPRVIQNAADSTISIGISQQGTKVAPTDGASTLAASVDQQLEVHIIGDMCMLQLGGTVVVGDSLTSDADGKGVVQNAAADNVGAIALSSGVLDEKIFVLVTSPGQKFGA